MSEMLIKAQEKLNSWQGHVNTEYKPKYHLSVPAGWLNDPNGFGFFQGKCHLFYRNRSINPRYRKVVVPGIHTAENHDFISSDQGSRSSISKSLLCSARSGNMLSR